MVGNYLPYLSDVIKRKAERVGTYKAIISCFKTGLYGRFQQLKMDPLMYF